MSSPPPLWPDEPDAESPSIADDAAAFAVYGLAKRLRGVAVASPLETSNEPSAVRQRRSAL